MSKMILAAAAAVSLLAGQAFAAEPVAINASNVNFNSRADVQQLYSQINAAAEKACSTDSKNKYVARPDRDCVAQAVAQAVERTNRPLLTAAYEGAALGRSAMATNEQ